MTEPVFSMPIVFSMIGILLALRYLKGMAEIQSSLNCLQLGFLAFLVTKVFLLARGHANDHFYYLVDLIANCWKCAFFTYAGCTLGKWFSFNKSSLLFVLVGSAVWAFYIVSITANDNAFQMTEWVCLIGYGFVGAGFLCRKQQSNSLGFVITGWMFILLLAYSAIAKMSWGQSLTSAYFETFLYIVMICGFLLISNNMMSQQFDSLNTEIEKYKEKLVAMVKLSPFPIVVSKLLSDETISMNDSAAKLFRVKPNSASKFRVKEFFADPNKRTELLERLNKNPVVDDFEFQAVPRVGEPIWMLLSARVFEYDYELALYMGFQDITERKNNEMKLFDQATKDPLTKCINRRQFDELSKKEVQRSRRYGHPFCLFMIDADHFKSVNDTHGHAVGDLVLQSLADCCRRTLRETDIISRFGGEEFVIMLPEATIENGHKVAERLRIRISKIVVKNEQNEDVRFTVSIGLVPSTVTDNVADMLKMSDEALYEAKEHGRNQVVVYTDHGPDRSIPVPDDEDIQKVKAEPEFLFKPTNPSGITTVASIKNKNEEPEDTGVFGLDGGKAKDVVEEELDDDEDESENRNQKKNTGGLNSLYDDDEDDNVFTPTKILPKQPEPIAPPPVMTMPEPEMEPEMPLDEPFPPVQPEIEEELPLEEEQAFAPAEPEMPLEEEVVSSVQPEIEEELPLEDEELPAPVASVEPEMPLEEELQENLEKIEEPAPAYDEMFAPPPVPESIPEDTIEQDMQAVADAILDDTEIPLEAGYEVPNVEEAAPISLDEPEMELPPIPVDMQPEEEMPMPPPPVMPQAVPSPVPPAPAKPIVMKKIIMKKMPLKLPAGLSKVPKMPGVIKMKIPKGLQTPTDNQ